MYSATTEVYKIPLHIKKDKVEASDLKRIYTIIENQLIAGTKGVSCCVFEDGRYDIEKTANGHYKVTLRSSGSKLALMGVLNYGLVKSEKPIVWDDLDNNRVHHLYACFTKDMYADCSAFHTSASTIPREFGLKEFLYLAKVDLTGYDPVIDTYPDGKVYSRDIALHASDWTNPHGEELYQDAVIIRDKLAIEVVEDDNSKEIELWNKKDGFNKELFTKKVILESKSDSVYGRLITIGNAKKILFVQVQEIFDPSTKFALGSVSVGYENQNQVRIYNNGLDNVPMQIMVWYE